MMLRVPQTSLAIGIGIMAMALHSSAMNATIPLMIKQNHLTVGSGQWVIAIYTLMLSSFLIISGCLGDVIGLRRVYLYGLLTVITSSALLIRTVSLPRLLLWRAIEGVGAALVSGTSLALVASGCASSDYVCSIGWQTGITYSGLVAGPVLSGIIAKHFNWHAIFLLNRLLCSAAFLIGCTLLNRGSFERGNWSRIMSTQSVWRRCPNLFWEDR